MAGTEGTQWRVTDFQGDGPLEVEQHDALEDAKAGQQGAEEGAKPENVSLKAILDS